MGSMIISNVGSFLSTWFVGPLGSDGSHFSERRPAGDMQDPFEMTNPELFLAACLAIEAGHAREKLQ